MTFILFIIVVDKQNLLRKMGMNVCSMNHDFYNLSTTDMLLILI